MKKIFLYPCFICLYASFISIFSPKALASFTKQSNLPILSVGTITDWDNSQVYGPTVIDENGIYKMWFSGDNDIKRQIGYADSIDLLNFSKYEKNPIITWNIISSNDIGVEHPSILKQGFYKMWFSNVETNFQNFKIYYSTSEDGFAWNNITPLIFDLTSTSWDSTGMGAPSVIYINQQKLYHLWYVARGQYNGTIRWRIGYATSSDGLNWTKHSTPVLEAQDPWEGWDVANPSVLFDESTGIYEMFYHGDSGIGRATSSDGINWTRDPANPILTPTANTFDSKRVFNPYVLKKDGIYYMWYTGINSDDKWQIGLATSGPIPTPLPTSIPSDTPTPSPTLIPSSTPIPTITPTVTPSLTPTITITSTPTPTPSVAAPFSPIIIVPGLGASWNPLDIFSCSIDISGKWEPAPYISIYNRLMKTLTENAGLKLNQDVYLYSYDWRQPLDKQGKSLKNFIDGILAGKPPDTKVRLIGHSLGGLVIRSYLENNPKSHHVASAMTIGTPHMGAVAAYPIWENGEIAYNDLPLQIAMTQVINHCRVIRTIIPSIGKSIPIMKFRTGREVIQYLTPIIRELLPVFDYLKLNNQIKSTVTLKNQNDWIPAHPFPTDKYDVDFVTLSGGDRSTLRYYDIINPTIREQVRGEWIDGKPVNSENINSGDGTVLNLSSQLNNAENESITGDHGDIVAATAGIQKILHFLGLDQIQPAAEVSVPEDISNNALTLALDTESKITITDPQGKQLEGKNNIFVSYNPTVGLYRLEISSAKDALAYLDLSQIVKNKASITKSYSVSITKSRPSKFYLIYNPANSTPLNLIPL